ncbi:MAG: hypothetical protein U0Q18_02625 [Bryobacteraceae bacterium]
MIYTCYEMIRDCRADKPEGWSFFLKEYVPVVRGVLGHYFPDRGGDGALLAGVLKAVRQPDSSLFQSLDPAPERIFVSELRQRILEILRAPEPNSEANIPLDLDSLSAALEPLTLTEKLVVWFETMRYAAGDTGRMLRMSAETAAKIRGRAAELIRGSVDSWSRTLLTDNGLQLGREAAARKSTECLPPRTFFDLIDGRTTWQTRDEVERHARTCWYCIDHYCRLLEAVDVLRASKPLDDADVEPFRQLLGIQMPKRRFWKGLAG